MNNFASQYDQERASDHFFGQAKVLSSDTSSRTAKVYVERFSGIQELHAAWALPYECDLRPGDRVLIAGESIEALFIIGVLTTRPAPSMVRSAHGASAAVVETDAGSKIQVVSKHGKMLIEYDETTERIVVNCPEGCLDIQAPTGTIDFTAADAINFTSDAIAFNSTRRLSATVQEAEGLPASSLSLFGGRARVVSEQVDITAEKGRFCLQEMRVLGERAIGNLARVSLKAKSIETIGQTIVSRAKNYYQAVQNLSQHKAGRLKTLITSSYHLKSKNCVMKAEDDFKIKGERINLG